MPLPDPYATEPVAVIDPHIWKLYLQASSNAEGWQREAEKLRLQVEEQLGEAHAGTVDGVKVLYHRPADRWAVGRILKDYPELSQQFMRPQLQDVFAIEEFRAAHPEIADQYQVRSFRKAVPK